MDISKDFKKFANTGKTPEQVKQDASRDKWLSAQEAVEYGIIDGILVSRK